MLADAKVELRRLFERAADKYEANRLSAPLLEQFSREPKFLTEVLEGYLRTPGVFDRGNYPVVGIAVDLNVHFGLQVNCWIPLPDRNTNLSTKAIHHHGDLLLSTVTLFGPGYEHWTFSTPETVDEREGRYRMKLLEAKPHPQHHVAFVDSNIPHTPFFPPELSITMAMFSSRHAVSWRDRAKRIPLLQGREKALRNLVRRLGLTKALAIKIVESFDFHPTQGGFQVQKDREEFALGPNEDHVANVFHTIQRTGNEQLSRTVREALQNGSVGAGRSAVERLLPDLEAGRPIEGRLSHHHFDRPHANFTREQIEQALAAN